MSDQPFTEEESAARIAGLILLNAMIFQDVLALHDERVKPLTKFAESANPVQAFCDHWTFIVEDINYHAIFHVASRVAEDLGSDPDMADHMKSFARTAQNIVCKRTALRHDLMGRVYHRLLVEAKYLGTYYTGIPAAALLLTVALRKDGYDVDWSSPESISNLRIADLACGTGTLLMAAADAVTDNHVACAAAQDERPQTGAVQRTLVEDVLAGFDVLSSAVHLTASTLALRAPDVAFKKMNLWAMPLGGTDRRLGSLDFLERNTVQGALWGGVAETTRIRGKRLGHSITTSVPQLDFCVMNPPFTRSVGDNLLFGSLPEKERKPLQTRLKSLVSGQKLLANITAGLGSVFVGMADKYIKPEGRIALVLPKSLISGVAWHKTRDLLVRDYVVEHIICSHDPERWNFSENTSLSEVLLIARKLPKQARGAGKKRKRLIEETKTVVLNLWHNPTTSFEALTLAHQLLACEAPLVCEKNSACNLQLSGSPAGDVLAHPWTTLRKSDNWMLPSAFAQGDLVRTAYKVGRGILAIPGYAGEKPLHCRPLGKLGSLGPDRRDIYDGFECVTTETNYPAFWGHKADEVRTVQLEPNAHLRPLSKARKNRKLRRPEVLWPRAGTVMIAERMRMNTQRICAVRLPEKALSNVWWPLSLSPNVARESQEQALVLWLNSTLGLLQLLADREETEGPWVDFKKPVLSRMPVLDVSALETSQLSALSSAFLEVQAVDLLPIKQIAADPVRAQIDGVFERTLGLPDLSPLRQMLGREPILSSKRLG